MEFCDWLARALPHESVKDSAPGPLEDTYDHLTAEKRRRLRGEGEMAPATWKPPR